MNMIFRFLRVILTAGFRKQANFLDETVIHFRVWPTDLDILWHMNNGKYLSVMDLGRVDMLMRNGLMRVTRANGWYPVIASETIRFRQSLQLWQRFELHTRPIGWDDRSFYVEQRFFAGGELIAFALVRARFLAKRGGAVDATALVAAVDPTVKSPPLPESVLRWQEAERAHTEEQKR